MKKGKSGNRQHNKLKCRKYFNDSIGRLKYSRDLHDTFNYSIHDKRFRQLVREENNLI